jgi:N-methylhydantoinase B/oxoprolinase/acetone carboxylase alpha subunit
MEKVTLKLHEFYALEAELNGVTNRQTGEILAKGLLNEKIKLTTKYWLHDLTKKVAAEKESVEKLKEELIKKYGTTDTEGNVSIPMYINEVIDEETKEIVSRDVNPDFVKFQNDFNGLLEEDREIEYKGFKLEEFDSVETDGNYNTLFKLIKVSE